MAKSELEIKIVDAGGQGRASSDSPAADQAALPGRGHAPQGRSPFRRDARPPEEPPPRGGARVSGPGASGEHRGLLTDMRLVEVLPAASREFWVGAPDQSDRRAHRGEHAAQVEAPASHPRQAPSHAPAAPPRPTAGDPETRRELAGAASEIAALIGLGGLMGLAARIGTRLTDLARAAAGLRQQVQQEPVMAQAVPPTGGELMRQQMGLTPRPRPVPPVRGAPVAVGAGTGGQAVVGAAARSGAAAAGGGAAGTAGSMAGLSAVAGPAALAVAALAAAVGGAVFAVRRFARSMEAHADELSGYSQELAAATAATDIRREEQLMHRARELGPDLAAFEMHRMKWEDAMHDIGTKVLAVLLDIFQALQPALEVIVGAVSVLPEFIAWATDILKALAHLAEWDFLAFAQAIMSAIEHAGEGLDKIVSIFTGEDQPTDPFEDPFTGPLFRQYAEERMFGEELPEAPPDIGGDLGP